ncbi:hypothetical protein HDV02_003673 [Globomyces sp. JEL0801]|nr:hypothetical protein HDV02_003673 [Globomyces sp. JEL0801]
MIVPQLKTILKNIPHDWLGTTFKNNNLLGRELFCKKLSAFLLSDLPINSGNLADIGNAEDYLRVSTNLSTIYELCLAEINGLDVAQVFSFASNTMGIIAVAKSTGALVHVYGQSEIFSSDQLSVLQGIGCKIVSHSGPAKPKTNQSDIIIALESVKGDSVVDAVLGDNVLYILNQNLIDSAKVLTIRKRMSTPITTPMALERLHKLAQLEIATIKSVDQEQVSDFNAHLQVLSGTDVDYNNTPVSFTAGLPALASLWTSLISFGGADVLMASTAYGGSSQLTDILSLSNHKLRKHSFDIQGKSIMIESIKQSLEKLSTTDLLPTTVLFCEIPTNPDMKVPDIKDLAVILQNYQQKTQKKVLLLIDSTFAPNSKIMLQLRKLVPDLNVMVFLSMSKSVSRGLTTAGCLVANHTQQGIELLSKIKQVASVLDTLAKPDQIKVLVENHLNVEKRCEDAYKVASKAGHVLVDAVKQSTGLDMSLAFVKPSEAAQGFTTSTFSFNLPVPKHSTPEINAALAQKFVDLLTDNKHFKPCVSFGQDNGLVYCTVPATSTQGVISEKDKQKQAVDGVQLVRLSFPPTCDEKVVYEHLENSVKAIYE